MGPFSRFRKGRNQASAAALVAPTPVAPSPTASAEGSVAPRENKDNKLAPAQEAISDALKPMLTLEDRGDGWDDVREQIRIRQKPWEELKVCVNDMPVVRWGRVLADEAVALASKK